MTPTASTETLYSHISLNSYNSSNVILTPNCFPYAWFFLFFIFLLLSQTSIFFLLYLFSPTPSCRACCLRFSAKRKILKQRPSPCWSTCAPCRTSCSCLRWSEIASIRMRGSAASPPPQRWAPPHSSAPHPSDLYRYQRPFYHIFSSGALL